MNLPKLSGIGVMSGSSLDGLDLALVNWEYSNNSWKYEIVNTESVLFPQELKVNLSEAHSFPVEKMLELDVELGKWIGNSILLRFKHHRPIDYIASHGHTVFHNPAQGYTLQIGKAEEIFRVTGIPVVSDFRSLDIALGGQGAPLAPTGDFYLFKEYKACLNLGGIANITILNNETFTAGDICGANQLLNYLASKIGLEYDVNGEVSAGGNIIHELKQDLDSNEYLDQDFPKSLGNEDLRNSELIKIDRINGSVEDKLHTVTLHIADQIKFVLDKYLNEGDRVLVTGGGAYNRFLMDKIQQLSPGIEWIIPSSQIIDFKEAMIFSFLGALRLNNEINCFSQITGASQDSVSGKIIGYHERETS